MIRVIIPRHLRTLSRTGNELQLQIDGTVTVRAIIDALEAAYPVLRGTIRDYGTLKRRPFVRFFACQQDISLEPPDTPVPAEVASGKEPFIIIGAMAGG